MEKRILGLDLGGTFIKYCLFDENDDFLLKGKEITPSNIEDFIVLIKELVNHFKPIEGIAISMPGFIDAKRGYAKTGGAIKYLDDTDIVKLFKDLFHVWVSVENDGRCATLAELETGNLKDVNNGIAIIVGTAIGGGISAEPLFIQYIQEGIDDIYSKNKDLPVKPNVDVCLYRNDANLLGALYNYKRNKK